jgi:hypothetical protein
MIKKKFGSVWRERPLLEFEQMGREAEAAQTESEQGGRYV